MAEISKTLTELGLTAAGGRDATITGLTVDSRAVKKGMLFAALPGVKVHGASFIGTALAQGATAILTDSKGAALAADELAASDAAVIVAQDPRQTLAQTASLWFGPHPSTVVAVTGTNGKTTTVRLTAHLLKANQLRVGPQKSVAQTVEGTDPHPPHVDGELCTQAGHHLFGRLVGKGDGQNPARADLPRLE